MSELVLRELQQFLARIAKLKSIWLLSALIPLLVALFDVKNLDQVLSTTLGALSGTLPYVTIAVILIGYLKATGAEAIVARAFEGREARMIILGAIFGGLAPFCSCEVIPFIAGLLAVGVPLSAVMAFWLSSPLIDPPTLLITASALGWNFAIAKAIAAVTIGLIGGFTIQLATSNGAFLEPLRNEAPVNCCGVGPAGLASDKTVWSFWRYADRRQIFWRQSGENALFLIKWLTFAYLLEALLIHYVPAELVAEAVGGEGVIPIIIGALIGAPAYLNSYAAPPLVAGLMEQGMTQGAAMAFMVSGAVSSIPAMAAVWSLVKVEAFAAYLGLGISGAIIIGIIFEAFTA